MRLWWLGGLTVGFVAGCSTEPLRPPAPPAAPPVRQVPENTPQANSELTEAQVQAYLRYQRRMREAYAGLAKELRALQDRPHHGGSGALAALSRRGSAQNQALREAGLSQDELERLEEVLYPLLAKRAVAKALQPEALMGQMDRLKSGLSGGQKQLLEQSLGDLRGQHESYVRLVEERQKFGDRNVDLLLAHEQALTENWEALLGSVWEASDR